MFQKFEVHEADERDREDSRASDGEKEKVSVRQKDPSELPAILPRPSTRLVLPRVRRRPGEDTGR